MTVVDGRPDIVSELREADVDVGTFVSERIAGHLQDPRFMDAINGHLPGDAASQARVPIVLERLREMAAR